MSQKIPAPFGQLDVLAAIGKSRLAQIIAPFADDLVAHHVDPPSPDSTDTTFFRSFTQLARDSESLPARVATALASFAGLVAPSGLRRIRTAFAHGAPEIALDPALRPESLAAQAWLAVPSLVVGLETYTLQPLVDDGPGSLGTAGNPEIRKVTLSAIHISWDNDRHEATRLSAEDVFAALAEKQSTLPPTATVTEATFELTLVGQPTPGRMMLQPPHTIEIPSGANPLSIQRWLCARGFRVLQKGTRAVLILAVALSLALTEPDNDPADDVDLDDTSDLAAAA